MEVCAQIQFINGTELTTSNYTVTISPVDDSAQSKFATELLVIKIHCIIIDNVSVYKICKRP